MKKKGLHKIELKFFYITQKKTFRMIFTTALTLQASALSLKFLALFKQNKRFLITLPLEGKHEGVLVGRRLHDSRQERHFKLIELIHFWTLITSRYSIK